MILERAPRPENLIESEIVKCGQSFVIKRDKAIESLRLEALKPDRLMDWSKRIQSRKKTMEEAERTPIARKDDGSANESLKLKRKLNLARMCKMGHL